MRMHIFVLPSYLHALHAFWRHKNTDNYFRFSVRHHLVKVKRTIVVDWIKDDRATYRAKHELLGDWRRKQMWKRKCAQIYMCVLATLVSVKSISVGGRFGECLGVRIWCRTSGRGRYYGYAVDYSGEHLSPFCTPIWLAKPPFGITGDWIDLRPSVG